MEFKKHLPLTEKIGLIAKKEAQDSMNKKEEINAKIIAKSTLKIFLKWIFCEDNKPLITDLDENDTYNEEKIKNLTYENTFKPEDFNFINQFVTDEFLERMYDNGLQWRKEIALKGKGCPI